MTTFADYSEMIPNNIDLNSDRRLKGPSKAGTPNSSTGGKIGGLKDIKRMKYI